MKTHRAARLVGLGASALVTAAGLLAAPAATPVASADDCPDVEVIFARGTNEPPAWAGLATPSWTRCVSRRAG
ncbi:cutinase domain protein [Mycobacterium intracellulare 1956]|uniref:Cutinase domain protein n=1 Tax=Mycobacterium intracellulare 1956 TaxID=1299331 RepID=X8CCL4_MYCIT|nr:cutinase domain protein [Mycobacterium intracellulare 1956]